jgi:Arm DNA-binding domain
MRVEPSGRAAYYVRYTARNGRKGCRIGARDSVTLRDTRQKAREIIAAVGAGRTRLPLPRIRERHVPPNVGSAKSMTRSVRRAR